MQPAKPSPPAGGAAPRLPRWLRRVALIAAVAGAAVALAAAVLVHELDAPWLKARLLSVARAASGLEVDYDTVRLRPLSGIAVEGLVVRTPPPLRGLVPTLARIGRLEASWSPGSLLGRGPRLRRVALDDVTVALAFDEHGRSSLDLASRRPEPSRPSAAAPFRLSHLAADLLSSAPPLEGLELSRLTVIVVRGRSGRIADRFTVRGLSLRADATPSGPAFRLRGTAGAPSGPLLLDIARDGDEVRAAAAQLEAALAADLSPAGAEISADVRVRAQTFTPGIVVRELLHVEASATFDAARGRTELSLARARAGDGAATLDGRLELADGPGARPLVRQARGDVDLVALLRLVPAGLVPARVTRGELHGRAEDVSLGAAFLEGGGSVTLDADVEDARVTLPGGALSAASAHLAIRASPGPTGHAALRARELRVESGPRRVTADGLEAELDGARAGDGVFSGALRVTVPALDVSGAGAVAVRQARLEARVPALRLVPGAPLATKGAVALTGEIAFLSVQAQAVRVLAEHARWDARVPLSGGPAFAARADAPVERLRLIGAEGRPIADGPAHLEIRASDVFPDPERPAASRGVADLSFALGTIRASLHAVKEREAVALDLRASAPGLASLRPSRATGSGWERMAIDLSSRLRIERLLSAAPRVEQQTALHLARPAWGGLSADDLTLDLRSEGDAFRHRAAADVRLRAVRGEGVSPADQHVALEALLDRPRRSVALRLSADGASAGGVSGALAFDEPHGALRCDLDGSLERVTSLLRIAVAAFRPDRQAALSGLELASLGVSVHGEVRGVLAAGRDGLPRPVADPLRAARGEVTAELRAAGFGWRTRERAVAIPSGRWRATVRAEGPRRSFESVTELGELHAETGTHRLDAAGIVHRLSASLTGDPATGEAEGEQRLEVASLRQDLADYPVEGARVTLHARRDRDGVVSLSDLRVENAAGGTALAAHGVIDAGGLRRRLAFKGRLEQDVARAWSAPATFAGSGRVTVDVDVESPDLLVFHTTSAVRFEDVHARLPAAGVAVEALDGEVPVSADVALRGGRVILLRQSGVNPYPALRFADQHPLLTHASFVSIGSLATPVFSAAPVAGNVKVEQNLVSVSQLEMGVRGGKVTGASVLDWNGPRTRLEARVRATGVLSSRGEPFDGNVAVVVSAADRSVEGRAEILRIGRRHLLDLLDLEDPHRTNAAANRVRHALSLGYPDRVRVTFDHGFASARVTFGGLARFVQLEELRGIPMGPLVDRVLAPLSRGEDPP